VTLWPRSLFGRIVLLLIAVVALAALATIVMFSRDRAALLAKQFGETKIVQIKALRAALEAEDGPPRRETLRRLGAEYGVRIVSEQERPGFAAFANRPVQPIVEELQERLRDGLGEGTEVRFAPRLQQVFVRVQVAGSGYWLGFPVPPPPAEQWPTRALAWIGVILTLLLIAGFVFARYLARPLTQLHAAVESVGRGETPAPLPDAGPSEIAAVNRGFNAMIANLRQIERDRALLLAGVSHDLRTPLARLRLGIEMGNLDQTTHAGMVSDIDEMNRVIGQFLDFARDEAQTSLDKADLNALLAQCVERYVKAGRDVRFAPTPLPELALRRTAMSRLCSNLIDNALAYGAPPIEVSTSRTATHAIVDVADHGPGIPDGEVERLKQPFTRGAPSRARADGAAGAGLGLAIVDRIARLHGGTFDLLPRPGGGTLARVALPLDDHPKR